MDTITKQEKNNRILIIDDDPGIRETYQNILSPVSKSDFLAEGASLFGDSVPMPNFSNQEKFELMLKDRGEKGVKSVEESIANKQPFSVAFIDMKMPGIDGAETARRIWEIDQNISIVFVTAFSEHTPDDINKITGRNDSFYLRKPFNPEEIKQFARALTNAWTLEREKERLSKELREANAELENINQTLNERVKQQTAMLIQSEKMASIGILAAGVAHEINNPISFINGNLSTMAKYRDRISDLLFLYTSLEKYLTEKGDQTISEKVAEITELKKKLKIDYIINDIKDLVIESKDGTDRIRKIVLDLKTFSRVDEAEYKYADLHEIIDSTLNMLHNEIKYSTKVTKDFAELPQIKCFPQKLSQVFMNLLINSVQAIGENGVISIQTQLIKGGQRRDDEKVKIIVSDNGCGIEETNIKKLFDPFFTTKPVGEGTGLGLSITYDIIKSHKGEISVESQVGQGTTFIIILPLEIEI
ncbi:response regulator [bacterium]|nr:response regulator [bacterium]